MSKAIVKTTATCLVTSLFLCSCARIVSLRPPNSTRQQQQAADPILLPIRTGITASELGLLVNDQDPQSVAVAKEYRTVRKIPPENVVHLSFPVANTLSAAQFAPLKASVDSALGAHVQGLAITWTQPYAVEGESVTSAFAMGLDAKWYNTTGGVCGFTAQWDYYDSDTTTPFTTFGIRPAMAIAGSTTQKALALIARGKAADRTRPTGTFYFVSTTDQVRSLRYSYELVPMANHWDVPGTRLTLSLVNNSSNQLGNDNVMNKEGVLGIFTGLASVGGIETNHYLPGAVADHLTSYGGMFPSGQMSSVNWLDGGLTASSGTVAEPCAIASKFSNPAVLIPRYFSGNTVLEAYAKSIQTPGESILIGDPLASPWGDGATTSYADGTFTITTSWMRPNHTYQLLRSGSEAGPFSVVKDDIQVTGPAWTTIEVPASPGEVFALIKKP